MSSPDRNVEAVREKMLQRSIVGLNKYGVTTERTDLTRKQWLIHAQEEAMDSAIYLQTIIEKEQQWQPIETAPQKTAILLACEFDNPGDWRIKCGSFYDGEWHVWGASWIPTYWMPLPDAPVSNVKG